MRLEAIYIKYQKMLLIHLKVFDDYLNYIRQISSLTYESPHYESLRKAFYEPSSCLGLLSEVRSKATSCIDISDGIAKDLKNIMCESKCGANIHINQIPFNKILNKSYVVKWSLCKYGHSF